MRAWKTAASKHICIKHVSFYFLSSEPCSTTKKAPKSIYLFNLSFKCLTTEEIQVSSCRVWTEHVNLSQACGLPGSICCAVLKDAGWFISHSSDNSLKLLNCKHGASSVPKNMGTHQRFLLLLLKGFNCMLILKGGGWEFLDSRADTCPFKSMCTCTPAPPKTYARLQPDGQQCSNQA